MISKQYFFISGLPRSGSTLLSAILRQNPDFYSDISSPVKELLTTTIDILTADENSGNISEDKRIAILKHIVDGYYSHINTSVVFDTSRAWTSSTSLLKKLFPYTKIICCVREINWILDSFERIAAKNCLYTNSFIDNDAQSSVETRCNLLMDPTRAGTVIKPWYWLQEGMALNPDMIYLVDYKHLCKNPKETLEGIYKFINRPYFNHDFNNVEYENETYDRSCNMKDLHTVRKKVEWVERKHILPNYVLDKYTKKDFWKEMTIRYE